MKKIRRDLARSVTSGLRALPYPRYLAAMWIINCELAEACRTRNTPEGADLANRSLAYLRVAIDRYPQVDKAIARLLKLEWFVLTGISEEDFDDEAPQFDLPVDPGVGNLWWIVRDLLFELETETYLYSAGASLTLAATMIEEENAEAAGHTQMTETNAVDPSFSSPMLQKCQTVLDLVGQPADNEIMNVDAIRSAVFGPMGHAQ